MTDFSLDRIGERLDHPDREPILSADDAVRVQWVIDQCGDWDSILDIGASDGAITKRLLEGHPTRAVAVIERHPAHRESLLALNCWGYYGEALDGLVQLPDDTFEMALLCEVLEHQTTIMGAALLREAKRVAQRVIVTVPNRNAKTYDSEARARWDWPDHRAYFDAKDVAALGTTVLVEPIVGSLYDSIWLGAVLT